MKNHEKEFHDRLYREDLGPRGKIMLFYEVSRDAHKQFYRHLLDYVNSDLRLLEIGCGTGSTAFFLAERGAQIIGIDISEEAIKRAKDETERKKMDARLKFMQMDAERLAFFDESFDVIYGIGSLHHLNLKKAYAEIARVLKPTGHAIFLEPLGHNPIINYFRARTPFLRSPYEHPFLMCDIKIASQFFKTVKCEWHALFSLCAIPFLKTPIKKIALFIGEILDRLILFNAEIGKFAWQVILIFEFPISPKLMNQVR